MRGLIYHLPATNPGNEKWSGALGRNAGLIFRFHNYKTYYIIYYTTISCMCMTTGGMFFRSGPILAFAVLQAVLFTAATAGGRDVIPGPVPARVLTVIDGDTILVRARIWLGHVVETRVRLEGVDTPELTGECERERRLARKARDFILARIGGGGVILSGIQYGKYAGRVVARVATAEGGDFSQALLEAGIGRPYDGGRRWPWCAGED